MFRFPLLFISVILFGACSNSSKVTSGDAQNHLTQKEKNDGWQQLFDGATTNGWHSYGSNVAGKIWAVNDGAIHMNAEAKDGVRGDLVTNEEYENFDLKLDWKISPKGNSGIIFYVNENPSKYPQTYNTGMEMQVLDNGSATVAGHPDAKIYTHRAGDLYDLLASKDAVKPAGEWNHIEIKSQNGKLDFYMNGEHTLSTTLWDDNWSKMIAISKFKDMPDFGTFKKGKIALQVHGNDVWFKNIRIKRL